MAVARRARGAALGLAALLAGLAALAGSSISATARAAPAPAARDRPVPILMYHHVSAAPAGTTKRRLWVGADRFRQQIDGLARAGYRAVTLDRVWRAWHAGGTLPAKPVVISFDDGYVSQYRIAARTLRRHRWPGVLFLEHRRLGRAGGLTHRQVARMIADGWELGAHTLTHPDLTTVDAARLRDEVAGSRDALRRDFGVAVNAFAYPYGRVNADVEAAVRAAGFRTATTIHAGLASPDDDPHRLDRILIDGKRSPEGLVALLRGGRFGAGDRR